MSRSADLVRAVAVAVTAVAQVASGALMPALSAGADTGAISDANESPVTPAGYAFAVWGLIYAASLALAVYQLLPAQRGRQVHRRTGWWLVGAFGASTIWVPIFGTRTVWLAQVVIVGLVVALTGAAIALTRSGAAGSVAERLLLRLPVTFYLGWAALATAAGFGTTFRSLGMPASAWWVTAVSLGLVLLAVVFAVGVVSRLTATAGFAATSCWALVAVAVGTTVPAVRWATALGIAVVLAALLITAVRSPRTPTVLLG